MFHTNMNHLKLRIVEESAVVRILHCFQTGMQRNISFFFVSLNRFCIFTKMQLKIKCWKWDNILAYRHTHICIHIHKNKQPNIATCIHTSIHVYIYLFKGSYPFVYFKKLSIVLAFTIWNAHTYICIFENILRKFVIGQINSFGDLSVFVRTL